MFWKKDRKKKIVNIPEADLRPKTLTAEEIEMDERKDLAVINLEFKQGFDFIKKYEKTVTFFGSARFSETDEHYQEARLLAQKVVHELGYAVMSGGGPGIMEAANRGAKEAGGDSLGLTIHLKREQVANPYLTDTVSFFYFFTRKTVMTFAAEAYIFFPGGFGTLDEFFDILTLVQTGKIPKVPIILVGRDFWAPMDEYIKKCLLTDHKSIDSADTNLYKIVDDHDEIVNLIKANPVSNWWTGFER